MRAVTRYQKVLELGDLELELFNLFNIIEHGTFNREDVSERIWKIRSKVGLLYELALRYAATADDYQKALGLRNDEINDLFEKLNEIHNLSGGEDE